MKLQNILSPLHQPLAKFRLIDLIKDTLSQSDIYNDFIIAVAYAKSGILKELKENISEWKKNEGKITALVGIDQKVTSKESLLFIEENFDKSFIVNLKGTTYHPKIYIFKGPNDARVVIGSNNLTSGGLETNFESSIAVDFNLLDESDKNEFNSFYQSINSIHSDEHGIVAEITKELIEKLDENNLLSREVIIPGVASEMSESFRRHQILDDIFKNNISVVKATRSQVTKTSKKIEPVKSSSKSDKIKQNNSSTLYIQITPHHNGEIFLSKLAVNENPEFFAFPFTGQTTPKKASSKPYPQREPDPIVNIRVYGESNKELLKLESYPLNTVFYETKGEIRITCSNLVGITPEYSILIMSSVSSAPYIDYEMVIHTPDSPYYEQYKLCCSKKMPTGGAKYDDGTPKPARKYGWDKDQ
ncbi:restriction endonuclease [Vibrio cholerae]|uniref:phospholipase D family protein n=1 Tax=Vibrio cholerae TaxID=666 RepID=UPI00155F5367|nr:phospholipase D family protein [Vibrio cholerae]NOF43862.1 restriction endonuclease [Vibrio cholerae]